MPYPRPQCPRLSTDHVSFGRPIIPGAAGVLITAPHRRTTTANCCPAWLISPMLLITHSPCVPTGSQPFLTADRAPVVAAADTPPALPRFHVSHQAQLVAAGRRGKGRTGGAEIAEQPQLVGDG